MKRLIWLLAVGIAAGVTGCVKPTPYQPAAGPASSATAYGYAETRVEEDRWRISFRANAVTRADLPSTYLLLRAAELTRAAGKDYFILTNEHLVPVSTVFSTVPRELALPTPVRVENGSVRGGGTASAPFQAGVGDLETVSRLTAYADVQMRAGRKPTDDPRAYDAREVLDRLGSLRESQKQP